MARTTHTDEHDPRWRAVAARDVRFDGSGVPIAREAKG
jgi:methylphosphotriester-DNA--protein-cysteine methyltransferase